MLAAVGGGHQDERSEFGKVETFVKDQGRLQATIAWRSEDIVVGRVAVWPGLAHPASIHKASAEFVIKFDNVLAAEHVPRDGKPAEIIDNRTRIISSVSSRVPLSGRNLSCKG
jgi:hypothetical protein